MRALRTTVKTITAEHEVLLNAADLIEMLNTAVPSLNIPANAEVTIQVPGGGDWSHMELSLREHPVSITWEVRS